MLSTLSVGFCFLVAFWRTSSTQTFSCCIHDSYLILFNSMQFFSLSFFCLTHFSVFMRIIQLSCYYVCVQVLFALSINGRLWVYITHETLFVTSEKLIRIALDNKVPHTAKGLILFFVLVYQWRPSDVTPSKRVKMNEGMEKYSN